jgi:hypothetical protein
MFYILFRRNSVLKGLNILITKYVEFILGPITKTLISCLIQCYVCIYTGLPVADILLVSHTSLKLLFTANKGRGRYHNTESHPYLGIFDLWDSHHNIRCVTRLHNTATKTTLKQIVRNIQ